MMTDQLRRLPQCIHLCRYALKVEKVNIAIPCAVKLIEVLFALTVGLDLWMVILADLGRSLGSVSLGWGVHGGLQRWRARHPRAGAGTWSEHPFCKILGRHDCCRS